MTEPRLDVKGIDKSFPGVHALREVSFDVLPGEVHALVGENGAGKSTLIKILSGVYKPDAGEIHVDGEVVTIPDPHAAATLGVSAVQQERHLVPLLSVAENMFLGREPRRGGLAIDFRERDRQAARILGHLGEGIDVRRPVERLSTAQRQMLAIGRAVSSEARVVIFDEPTASLSRRETESLFQAIRGLAEQGIAIIYVSHRLEEIFEIAGRVTVLRDGEVVGTRSTGDVTADEVIAMMIGRPPSDLFVRGDRPTPGAPLLEVRDLSLSELVKDVSLVVRAGELVVLAGLVGSGRTELVRGIFGADRIVAGTILFEGREIKAGSPRGSVRLGVGLAPEDRKGQGLVLPMSVKENIGLARTATKLLRWYDPRRIARLAARFVEALQIKVASIDRPVRLLSGGNQQRVVIAKWLATDPRILILDEPTQGIDVGAKGEIYRLISELLGKGLGILMVSSDLPEVVAVADRILVMRRGRIVAEFDHAQATEELVARAALGDTSRSVPQTGPEAPPAQLAPGRP
jgi:rhamnose transport system ATP-binding protein